MSIGVFDGVHRGHRHLLDRMVTAARQRALRAVVVTFDPHPLAVLRPGREPARLASLGHRLDLLAAAGIDATLVLPFTAELAAQSADDFVTEVLVGSLRAGHVVVGDGFRFGHRAAGDVGLLTERGHTDGFTVEAVPLARAVGSAAWSSTWVRERVAAGDAAGAATALGRPHRVEGTVVEGDRRGRTLGYPTANVAPLPGSAVPADGVYAGWLHHAAVPAPAAVSIGTNPTFGGAERRVEAYVLDRTDLSLYGEAVAVDFAARLRDTERFADVAELLAQMAADVAATRAATATPPA